MQTALEQLEAAQAAIKEAQENYENAMKQDHEDSKRKLEVARKTLREAEEKKAVNESATGIKAATAKQEMVNAHSHKVGILKSQYSAEREIFKANWRATINAVTRNIMCILEIMRRHRNSSRPEEGRMCA